MKFGKHNPAYPANHAGSCLFEFSNGHGLSVHLVDEEYRNSELGKLMEYTDDELGYEVVPTRFGCPAGYTSAPVLFDQQMYNGLTAEEVEQMLDYAEVASTYVEEVA